MTETRIGDYVTVARDGAVATVTMDRGDGRNALSRQLILELTEAARSFADDLTTQAVIVTGKGAFTAGADLKDPGLDRRRANGLLERRHMVRIGPELCEAWERVEQVTICAIEKYCIGGGAALAAACDFRIMAKGCAYAPAGDSARHEHELACGAAACLAHRPVARQAVRDLRRQGRRGAGACLGPGR